MLARAEAGGGDLAHRFEEFAAGVGGRGALHQGFFPTAFVGAGIVQGSDPESEWRETELKLGVVTALFGAPLFALIAWRAARNWRG